MGTDPEFRNGFAMGWRTLRLRQTLGDVGLAQKQTSPLLPYNGRSTRGYLSLSIELLCFSPRSPETAHGADLRRCSYRGLQRSRAPPCAASVLG
ncbi:protein of unknown function [Bradyrhizobium vignae]|uniref:Uncharacterized protein n=1 Tax=Bradyrhizobium vignae TaxID=1549949 RepID=A0A2U3QBI2_9BRAD|nr:protein of unknown function [Bradyrhizobium vignae]